MATGQVHVIARIRGSEPVVEVVTLVSFAAAQTPQVKYLPELLMVS